MLYDTDIIDPEWVLETEQLGTVLKLALTALTFCAALKSLII